MCLEIAAYVFKSNENLSLECENPNAEAIRTLTVSDQPKRQEYSRVEGHEAELTGGWWHSQSLPANHRVEFKKCSSSFLFFSRCKTPNETRFHEVTL